MKAITCAAVWLTTTAFPLFAQQGTPEELVQQLADANLGGAARAQLVAMGSEAVPALAGALAAAKDAQLLAILGILTELGPAAGAAVPQLTSRAQKKACVPEVVATLAELAPWCGRENAPNWNSVLGPVCMAMHGSDGSLSREAWILCERLHVRSTFATDVAIEELIRVIEGRRAWHRELAIELLGRRAREAGAALPALQRVLEQPEPRLLLVERTVPLHAKAARAVLAIAPGSGAAVLARDVLAGTRPAPAASALPARTQGRIAELVLELEEPATRDAAVANLGALGAAAAEPVAAALATSSDADVQRAALAVLRDLGPGAAAGTQHLLEATRTVPVDMLLDTLRVLVVAAAGTADVLSSLETIHMRGRVVVLGRRLDGVDEAFGERLSTIESEHFAAQLVDANGTMREIEEWLALPDPYIRERALAAVAKRGNAARPLLGKLGEMLRATHPSGVNSNGAGNVDRTSSVQRAAASAILAVAPAGDPLLDQARALLVEPERTK